ncbi:MAG TPA: sigma-54 dependent transcriptional regulator [Candidatus Kryptonia bacterium]|nr:sigma-54 dependent transcriptional regulator [Candidatus Kryptonia bacterium]
MATAEIGKKGSILIAEDETTVREDLADVLRDEGYQVAQAADGAAAIAALDTQEFDLVLTDLRMPNADGIAVLQHSREVAPQTLVLLMTAHATVETAVEALRRGAQDYLLKPVLIEDVLHKIEYLLQNRQLSWENQFLRRQAERQWDVDGFVGRSSAMEEVMSLVRRVGPTPSTVLITGESGVGKEVVARAIHHFSEQRDRIFLPVNCGAIPEKLIESQLFGHLRGSFTGAISNQEGLFQRARGGTIFLDEIGDLPLNLQVKLLRAIEAKEILPIGATTPITIDLRVIAATNRDLLHEVDVGTFRDDLYYRLSVVRIDIPPLRERREAIPALIEHFIQVHNRELKKSVKGADSTTIKLLMAQPWKGNIRELDNVIEHAMIVGDGDWITQRDLPRRMQQETDVPTTSGDNLRDALRAFEKIHIQGVLTKVRHDKKAAAKQLGVSLASLYRKIDDLELASREPSA